MLKEGAGQKIEEDSVRRGNESVFGDCSRGRGRVMQFANLEGGWANLANA